MNLGELSIKKSVITVTLTLVLLVAGTISFLNLSRLEDPEFTIKDALITTPYPGASAEEVEKEVTNVIEKAVQELGQLKRIESFSQRGLSIVKATIQDKYDKNSLPQIWDELRRKVNDNQVQLPPEAGPSIVNDDFGDVYGVFIAISGEGYTYAELKDFVDLLRRELLLVRDVKKIILYGVQPEAVYVEMSRPKMAALGISQDEIYSALREKNLPADSGRLELGSEYIPINPTGEFTSEEQFGDLLISSKDGASDRLVYLKDVATVRRGYVDPPKTLLRFDGKPAIGLAISTRLGGNVATMGQAIEKRLKQLLPQAPLGMEIGIISDQSAAVTTAINGFMINLIEAVIIVVVVLLIFMGLRSGLIIGFILYLTIAGTFLVMGYYGIILERISLGALIIALGMLVDNAIVIVEGMKVKMEQGTEALEAAKEIVGQNSMPLLGATVVAILAFAAIGTSNDSTGEYCRSLFTVILISLGLSWLTAVTTTPLLCKWFVKGKPKGTGDRITVDPYGGKFFQIYRGLLKYCIRFRWFTVAVVVVMFVLSLLGFGFVKNMFFPNSTRPQFFVDIRFRQGSHIDDNEKQIAKAEKYLTGLDGITHVTSAVGGGEPRFLLTYAPNRNSSSFTVIFVDVDDYRKIGEIIPKVQQHLEEMLPGAIVNVRKFLLGPGEGGKIQLRVNGPDPTVLRQLAAKVKAILEADPGVQAVWDEWREKEKVVRPQLAEAQARQLGITRPNLARAIEERFQGTQTGVYRDKSTFEPQLLPIIARAPKEERGNVDTLRELQIWSPPAQRMIPIGQVLKGFDTETEDATIGRWNRTTMLKIHADPKPGVLVSEIMPRVKPEIEKALKVDLALYYDKEYGDDEEPFEDYDANTIPIKELDQIPLKDMAGYFIAWGGEQEDSARAQKSLYNSMIIFAGIMVLVVIFLFNAIRQPLIIWLTVPLSLIGVTIGLLLFKQPFGFMALLGLLSLSGMLIKNAIVLINQIDLEIGEGKERFLAVVDSGVSRLRPVAMAALTTILGMIPLLQDAFFISMAVTIMCGLAFATLLTLIVVPVIYTIFFRIPSAS